MKFRVIFLTKKSIFFIAAAIVILIIGSILIFSKKAAPTFSVAVDNTTKKLDLTGDGKEDILYIKTDKDKYFVQVNTQNKSIFLEPGKKLNTIGTYYSYCPMRLFIMDVSRDNIPEIFIQSLDKNKPVQHTFVFNNGIFENIYSASSSILGFMDSGNSKTPKVLSGNLSQNKIELSSYIYLKGKPESFSYGFNDNFMGKDSIFTFIKYIESLPYGEAYMPQIIFYPGLNGKDLSLIGKLAGENCTYVYQNAMFKDIKWNKAGEPTEVTWSISFRGISNTDINVIKNHTINLKLKTNGTNSDKNYFKIYSISLE